MARRAANFRRLADVERLDELDAEHWIAAWEREGERLGLERHSQAFWEAGRRWIGKQRAARRSPAP